MKKFTLIAIVLLSSIMVSCTKSPKEAIMKATDALFTQAENEVQAITNSEDFVAFFNAFEQKKEDFVTDLYEKYPSDEDGNFKGMSAAENEALWNYIYDRATAYNEVEAKKCGEVLEPVIAHYEENITALYEKFQAGEPISYEMIEDIFADLEPYAELDNVPTEIQTRLDATEEMVEAMLDSLDDEEEYEEE